MPSPSTHLRPRALRAAAVLAAVALVAAGCDGSGLVPGAGPGDDETTAAAASEAIVTTNVDDAATGVPVDKVVKVKAEKGTLSSVVLKSKDGRVDGELRADGTRWTSAAGLEPGVRYRVRAVAENADGKRVESVSSFTTQALSLDQQTYPSVAPLQGETVGVGMPVVVTFDLPVADQAAFEKHMTVTSTPAQPGTWHWISSTEAHWRPEAYWQAGSKVSVDVAVNGVSAGGGIYGQDDRTVDFEVGASHIYKVNAKTHQMKVFENGKLLRTIPVTTGKPGFTTRSGVKVIMEKYDQKRMNSETVGISRGSAEAYDIDNVKWAMRLTSSGEFIHAAPWSVGSQGRANVSHGCTGLSTDNAGWLYGMTRRGDVVEYVGTDRPMESGNGWGDWNVPWGEYVAGSALS
ncbi:L,D-transpeptidase [Nocardioides carbamazepini]|uniref:L,D-transpeptidase n=1 Tax=Nocardioides carbamazepini TaxID=2854259 RepID=UPI00214A1241|nr:Ig-like domain-containing protein [Nocardioides carbamazepini]